MKNKLAGEKAEKVETLKLLQLTEDYPVSEIAVYVRPVMLLRECIKNHAARQNYGSIF